MFSYPCEVCRNWMPGEVEFAPSQYHRCMKQVCGRFKAHWTDSFPHLHELLASILAGPDTQCETHSTLLLVRNIHYLVQGNPRRIMYLLPLMEIMLVDLGGRRAYPRPRAPVSILLWHHRLLDLSLSVVLARSRNPNVNILGRSMPDLLPQTGAILRRKV